MKTLQQLLIELRNYYINELKLFVNTEYFDSAL